MYPRHCHESFYGLYIIFTFPAGSASSPLRQQIGRLPIQRLIGFHRSHINSTWMLIDHEAPHLPFRGGFDYTAPQWDLTVGQLDVTVSIQRFKEKGMILTGWLLSIRQICAFSGPSVTSKHLDFTTIFWPRLLTHILGDK